MSNYRAGKIIGTECPVLRSALPTALRGRCFLAHPYPAGGGGGVGVLAVGGITAALAIVGAIGTRAVAVVELHRGIVRFGAGGSVEMIHGGTSVNWCGINV